jgi:hypothetical protein
MSAVVGFGDDESWFGTTGGVHGFPIALPKVSPALCYADFRITSPGYAPPTLGWNLPANAALADAAGWLRFASQQYSLYC